MSAKMHYHCMYCAQRVPNIPGLVNVGQMLCALNVLCALALQAYMLLIVELHALMALEVGQSIR